MRSQVTAPLSPRRRPGATLTEILVVTALISVMASFSFFAFTSAKRFGDRIENEASLAVAHVNRSMARSTAAPLAETPSLPVRSRTSSVPRPDRVPGQYFVALRPSVQSPGQEAQRLASLVGGEVISVYTTAIFGFSLKCNDALAARLGADPAVEMVDQARYVYACQVGNNIKRVFSNGFAENQKTTPNFAAPDIYGLPTSIYRMSYNTAPTSTLTSRFYVAGASSQTRTIAIMDTGIDNLHPDLFVVAARDFTGGANPRDLNGHGTHIAGVVGAKDSSGSGGVLGVYPGAPLVNLKVMNTLSIATETFPGGTNLAVYDALTFLIQNAGSIKICLMCFETGPDVFMNRLVDAAANAGVLMVAAAGHTSPAAIPVGTPVDARTVSPASASQAIVVGALVDTDGKPGRFGGAGDDVYAGYSNTNASGRIDFVAPGGTAAVPLRSTIPLQGQVKNSLASPYSTLVFGDTGANAFGTSFAAAHVAGLLGLLTDRQTSIGFVVGGRSVTTFAPQMTNRVGAINGLTNLTHQPTRFQMISPLTGRAWDISGVPRRVTPYTKELFDDRVNGIPVPNLYVNPSRPPANLNPFPG